MGIGLGAIILQRGIVHDDHLIRAVFGKLIRQFLYAGADQDRRHLCVQRSRQILCFSDQFEGDAAQHIIHLLGKYIYSLALFNFQ